MKRRSGSRKRKPWTVLVYLAGDNDLGPEMVWCLQEMKEASRRRAIRDALNLLVELDAAGSSPRRYDLTRPAVADEGDLAALGREAPRLASKDIPVERFLFDAITELPRATRCAVILSGHGSGAVGDFLPDLEPRSALSIPVLGRILERTRARLEKKTARGEKVALLGLDSCQMSSVETAYEVRNQVLYLVASEGTVLNAGWPYHRVLTALARSKSAEGAARAIVRNYLRFYRDYELTSQSTDIAVCTLSKIDVVAEAIAGLAEAMRKPLARLLPDGLEEGVELGAFARTAAVQGVESARDLRDAIVLAHWSAQSYKSDRYVDLADFCAQLARYARRRSGAEAARVVASCERLARAVASAVLASGTTGPQFQHSRGLSIYFPWASDDYDKRYRRLGLARKSGWARFLETYLESTRRMRRGQELHLAPGPPPAPDEPSGRRHGRAKAAVRSKDPDAGTHRGPTGPGASGMKNPPDGYYDDSK